ncbi:MULTISPECIES: FtsH protease activity modulator HflK [unclassified Photobacterium]|uniref:FtsH protease activity modulator HflK n=1 Tax=unclassified Photobacterium TaxID=2628852 RepID=UPI000D1726A2|nr:MULTISPECIES: FtsH protease activity modulator HflK [unclassified Photobacterium]PSV23839.1 FtsH protease activity modulator HflK [Photobacterium sp. GB-56]PSV29936.1 FtsH protease activity modulator HflK [Photobacterium sp. GB-72]PSV35124.1 FtsH protease activity modulator HflK [Photobacterium sp. GB-210]PSV36136.1 FtsH protease activity modulator HflK [Photobacterium sp. GB-27]PSV41230.1 FtsH protease activity modulator HflK [Photobacterium sp. GB-36]
MAWNEPGNNGGRDDKDPWGNNNRGGREQGPPDLDEVFSKLSRKVGGVFGNKKGPSGSGSAVGLGAVAVLAAAVWGFSGFYTIGEAEQGVVLRFGKFDQVVKPGLNWKPTFIDEVIPVNIQAIRSLRASGLMLTKDENVLKVEMDVQYRVDNAEKYLFSVTNADDSLRQATDSALRAVIGDSTMDQALTTGRQTIRANTQAAIDKIIAKYDMGIRVVDVNFQSARPPEAVKDAFDDAIAAREDEERYVREAEAYSNDILPKATGRAERLKNEAEGYSERVVNGALGDVAQFDKLLPQYLAAKEVTRERLYLDTMEKVYSNTSKVLIDTKSGGSNNMMYLPLDKLMSQSNQADKKTDNSDRLSGIELEKVETPTPVAPASRADTGRQGRY